MTKKLQPATFQSLETTLPSGVTVWTTTNALDSQINGSVRPPRNCCDPAKNYRKERTYASTRAAEAGHAELCSKYANWTREKMIQKGILIAVRAYTNPRNLKGINKLLDKCLDRSSDQELGVHNTSSFTTQRTTLLLIGPPTIIRHNH